MRHAGATHIHSRLGRGEPEHSRVDLGDAWGQHGHSDGDSTHFQPGFTPYSRHLEPVLEGKLCHINHWDVDNTMDNHDCVAETTLVTVAESTCSDPHPGHPMRCPSRQAMDIPYNTMVSFTKEVNHPCNRHVLTHVGEESAHVYLAVLLLRESFDSVQRCWMP
jgi:hypothetical protein